MKKWQESRNYRKFKQSDGSIKNIIYADGQTVEVTDEVYRAYSQMDRQERYQLEHQSHDRMISLEKMLEDDMRLEYLTSKHEPSAEHYAIVAETEKELTALLHLLPKAMNQLAEDEQALILALFLDGTSAREYARRTGVTLRAIQKRRDRILGKLKNIIANL